MPTNVIMRALELAQETGKVLPWLKAPGDRVAKVDPIVEIETDKGTVAPRHEAYLPPNAGPTVIATEKIVQPHPIWRTRAGNRGCSVPRTTRQTMESRSVAEGP